MNENKSIYKFKDPFIQIKSDYNGKFYDKCEQCKVWKFNNQYWCNVCEEFKSFIMINYCPESKIWRRINNEYLKKESK